MDDAQLQTVWRNRQANWHCDPIARPLAMFMKHTLGRRVKQVGKLVGAWQEVIPAELAEHTCLESFQRGVLTVLVDTAAHRFQLQNLLNAGLIKDLQKRFGGPLNRVKLVPGQFYSLDDNDQRRFAF